ncbi:hypothetical protein DSO57_1020977 [Entomophthora muscae]|nr:hypothetical protein DSO57_1020977 [Entomophthora muscae]
MYSQETAFDCLLHSRPLKKAGADLLQTKCRFFVNLLRSNCLIRSETVEGLRSQLIKCGWRANRDSQEDAVEFFLFLTGVFELPFLPLNIQLFHGALEDASDDKFTADRVLALSLPPSLFPSKLPPSRPSDLSLISGLSNRSDAPSREVISVETLLLDYFCSNRIQGIRRSLQPSQQSECEKTAVTDAWSMLKLLPFYTSQNELGVVSEIREADLSDPDLILPLMIKRYTQAPDGTYIRDSRHIALSTEINFNNFIKRLDEPIAEIPTKEYRLQLKAVVCHIGTSLQSGHYIVYVRDTVTNDWLELDDLSQEKVRRFTSVRSATKAFARMGQNAYLLLYKLSTGPSSSFRADGAFMDAKVARKLQVQELSNLKEKSCPIQ